MSLARRTALVHLARKHNALIITDDVYDFLSFPLSTTPPTAPLPRLSTIDAALPPLASDPGAFHHTLSYASFSKILGPGVRTGWTSAAPALAYAISQTGSSRSGGCPSQLVAAMITQLVTSGELQRHIAHVLISAYGARHAAMRDAVQEFLAPAGVVLDAATGYGGYFMWLKLPPGIPAKEVAKRALEREELIVAPGDLFEVKGDSEGGGFEGYVRLCFAYEDVEDLVEGVKRLGRVTAGLVAERRT